MQSINTSVIHFQAFKDGSDLMTRRTLIKYVQDLINDHVDLTDPFCSLYFSDLTHEEKKTLFFYTLDSISDFEWFCKNPIRLQEGFNEYQKIIQDLLDEYVQRAFCEYMEDMGARAHQCPTTGETYWSS
jgi:hypothetical protein